MQKKKALLFLACAMYVCTKVEAHDSTTLHHYFWANYQHFSGNLAYAHHWYEKALTSGGSLHGYQGYLSLLEDTKQYDMIVSLMPRLQKRFAQNPDIQLIFATALQETKQVDKADALILSLSQSFKTHSDIALRTAQIYLRRQETENAQLTIQAYLNNTPRRPNNFIFYFLQSHISLQLNESHKAREHIQKCLELHPHFDKGWLVYATLHEKDQKIEEAINGYSTFLELTGSNKQIEHHIMQLTLKHELIKQNKQHLLAPSISTDNALILFQQKRFADALKHIDACLEKQPANHESVLLKIEILSAMNNFSSISTLISQWIEKEPENQLWPKTVCLLVHSGMPQAMIIETLANALKKHPGSLWSHLYCADMCMRIKDNDTALHHLDTALSHITDKNLASKTAYQMALIYYDTDTPERMYHYLEKAYTYNPQCPHINNTLAYYWATTGKNIDKASVHIKTALAHNKNNPYFLDTHALILYKQKEYTQARHILEQLIAHNNGMMLLHLAKVHYALDNKQEADTFVKKAELLVKNNHEKKALEKMKKIL
jgi:tetratricopeptide (TPR) repeat protein